MRYNRGDGGADEAEDYSLAPETELNFDHGQSKNRAYPKGRKRIMLFGEIIADSVAKSDEASRSARAMWRRCRAEETRKSGKPILRVTVEIPPDGMIEED